MRACDLGIRTRGDCRGTPTLANAMPVPKVCSDFASTGEAVAGMESEEWEVGAAGEVVLDQGGLTTLFAIARAEGWAAADITAAVTNL